MTPAARIVLDGKDITANLIPAPFGMPLEGGGHVIPNGKLGGGPLLSLTVTDNEGKQSDSVQLEIDNRMHVPAPKEGAQMQVWLGYAETGLVFMGLYTVDSWTKKGRPLTMSVSAKAAGFTTDIKAPRNRSYHEKNVQQIVQEVAGRHGMSALVHPELASISIKHIDQQTESDVGFLTRIGERVGGNFKLANGNMILNKAGSGDLPSGGPAPTFSITEVGLLDWSAQGAARGSYKSVSSAFQNTEKGEREWITEGEGEPKYRDRKLYKTEEEAKTAAKARLGALQRGKVSLSVSMPGRPEIFAGCKLQVSQLDPDVDGSYIIKTATHKLDNGGETTSLQAESEGGAEGYSLGG